MKYYLSFALAVLIRTSISSQTYLPTLKEGNSYEVFVPLGLGQSLTVNYSIGCDTVINGARYNSAFTSDRVYGYFKEDTIAQRIYKLNEQNTADDLVIDYSLMVGDSMKISGGNLVVDSIRYITLFEKSRKVIYFNGIQYFIEGVGYSFYGVTSVWNGFSTLREFQPSSTACNGVVAISDLLNEETSVYPNPTSGSLTFKDQRLIGRKAIIFNALGQKVKVTQISEQVDVSELNPDLYFIVIEGSNNAIRFSKL